MHETAPPAQVEHTSEMLGDIDEQASINGRDLAAHTTPRPG